MIKTRLVGLLSHAKKYIVYTILWQWAALLSQVVAVFFFVGFMGKEVNREGGNLGFGQEKNVLILVLGVWVDCEREGGRGRLLGWGGGKGGMRGKK